MLTIDASKGDNKLTNSSAAGQYQSYHSTHFGFNLLATAVCAVNRIGVWVDEQKKRRKFRNCQKLAIFHKQTDRFMKWPLECLSKYMHWHNLGSLIDFHLAY